MMDWEDVGNKVEAWLRRKFSPDQRGEFQRGGKLVEAGSMGKIKSGLFYVGCTLMAIVFIFNVLVDYIPPNQYGVREVRWSMPGLTGPKGIRNEKLETGYYVVFPILMTLHRLPRHPVVLDFHYAASGKKEERYSSNRIKSFAQLRIQTSDGFFTDNDLSIMARIVDPYKTLVGIGPGNAFITDGLLPKTDNALKFSLGLMDTEQYYQWPMLRYLLANGIEKDFDEYYRLYKAIYDKKMADVEKPMPADEKRRVEALFRILEHGRKVKTSARSILNQELEESMGINTVFAAVRYFHFSKEINDNIRGKVLQVQQFELNTSLKALQSAKAILADVEEKGKQSMLNLGADGTSYYDRKMGDKEKLVRVTDSNGDKLSALARAYRDKRERDLLEIPGSDNWVNLQVADSLRNTGLIMTTPEAFKHYLAEWGK